MLICYVDPSKRKGGKVCKAFAQGAGGQVSREQKLRSGPAAFWGITEHLAPLWARAKGDGRDWYYLDNGYMPCGIFYRATKNAVQISSIGSGDYRRFARLNIELRPWRRDGRHILVCPPGEHYGRLLGFDHAAWLSESLTVLRSYSDREIRIRTKPPPGVLISPSTGKTLEEDLKRCWALVSRHSNTAVEAVCAGVPAFVTHECAATAVGLADLSLIETPVYPDRETWAACLAANQWTKSEMRDGMAWRALNGMG
jgi:hypothetical protein